MIDLNNTEILIASSILAWCIWVTIGIFGHQKEMAVLKEANTMLKESLDKILEIMEKALKTS